MYALDIYIIYVYLTSSRFHNLAATSNSLRWQENHGFTHSFAKNGKKVKFLAIKSISLWMHFFQLSGYAIF